MIMTHAMRYFGVFLILACLLPACYEPQDGCLDIRATNFDPTADNPCDNCCSYPNLVIRCTHVAGSGKFSDKPKFADVNGDSFSVEQVRFVISDVSLELSDGSVINITDTVQYIEDTDTTLLPDSYAVLSTGIFDATVGTLPAQGTFTKLHFKVGVVPDWIWPGGFPTGHPIADATLYDQTFGYRYNTLTINRFDPEETTSFVLLTPDYLVDVTVPFGTPVEAKEGYDTTVKLKIDHQKWFTGIDLSASNAEILDLIFQNTPTVFSIE